MKILVDASMAHRNSLAVCVEGWLAGWPAGVQDTLHVMAPAGFIDEFTADVPESSRIVFHEVGMNAQSRLRTQCVDAPRIVRRTKPDVMFCAYPVLGPVPRSLPVVAVAYDFRYELRRDEFSAPNRIWRWVQYNRTFRRAHTILTISDRTRSDLAISHPEWLGKAEVAHLGVQQPSHVARTEQFAVDRGHAIAYAQHVNKRPELALAAWAEALSQGVRLPRLVILGASGNTTATLEAQRAELGLSERDVTVSGRLAEPEYQELINSARLVLMPSVFEGFGLPVIESLARGIPVVITPEPAMMEIGGSLATVSADDTPVSIAGAVRQALSGDPMEFAARARDWAAQFTWQASATKVRCALARAASVF